MKTPLIIFLFVNILFGEDPQSIPITIYNNKIPASVENNFKEQPYFQTSNPVTATGVIILEGVIHSDKIIDSFKNPQNKSLKKDFSDHNKFNK